MGAGSEYARELGEWLREGGVEGVGERVLDVPLGRKNPKKELAAMGVRSFMSAVAGLVEVARGESCFLFSVFCFLFSVFCFLFSVFRALLGNWWVGPVCIAFSDAPCLPIFPVYPFRDLGNQGEIAVEVTMLQVSRLRSQPRSLMGWCRELRRNWRKLGVFIVFMPFGDVGRWSQQSYEKEEFGGRGIAPVWTEEYG